MVNGDYIELLWKHLESQFESWMTRENQGVYKHQAGMTMIQLPGAGTSITLYLIAVSTILQWIVKSSVIVGRSKIFARYRQNRM